ncbi:hypothetical protein [Asticcacaulis sp. 201]|uniref:hypothetical protein n=1 Tax=Asticcacaulis sp. 201 TaxID=3028787 RepID=UPI002916E3A2|nr:hypothetical protein [Asticcacaulis sp. 201]MDV6329594.1 hypothetical protein [Asticcacaulis sp. 201]
MAKLCLPIFPASRGSQPTASFHWLPFLFLLPLILGIAAKICRSKYWFGDYQAVACAGLKVIEKAPFYTLDLQCAGMRPSSFVYIPAVAHAAAFFETLLTERGFFCLYLLVYLAAIATLFFVPFLARRTPGAWMSRLPFAVFISGSAVMWGNIAVILHAGVLVAALALEITPWLFVAAIVVASWVKPVFLTYLVVILIVDLPALRRLRLMAIGVGLGILPMLTFMLTGGDLARQWYALLSHFVYDVTPGYGFFGWVGLIGLDSNGPGAKIVYMIYAATLALSGLALSERLQLSRQERIWLGLSLAVLLIPRIMSQDVFLLGPGLWVAAQRMRGLMTPLHEQGDSILLALCSVALAGALTGLGAYSVPVALFGFSLYLLWSGGYLAAPFLLRLKPVWLHPASRKASLPGE